MRGLTILLALIGVSCATATGDVSGGEEVRLDAAAPVAFVSPEPTYLSAPADTWTGIYRDLFGRHSPASCAGTGLCHDTATKPGATASNFVCADLDSCYTALRTAIPPRSFDQGPPRPLIGDDSLHNPDDAYIFSIVRYREPDGTTHTNQGMPQLPTDYFYSTADVARLKAWMAAGAPQN